MKICDRIYDYYYTETRKNDELSAKTRKNPQKQDRKFIVLERIMA